MRFIPTRIHGFIDYIVGIVLIAAPWLLGFSDTGAGMWVPVIVGAGIIVASLLTNYELGVVGVIPMSTHLVLDIVAGVVLVATPWLLGYADEVWAPHVIVGLLEVGAGLMTQTEPSRPAAGSGAGTRR